MAIGEAEVLLKVRVNMWIPGNREADPEKYKERLQERMGRIAERAINRLLENNSDSVRFEVLITPHFREVQEQENGHYASTD